MNVEYANGEDMLACVCNLQVRFVSFPFWTKDVTLLGYNTLIPVTNTSPPLPRCTTLDQHFLSQPVYLYSLLKTSRFQLHNFVPRWVPGEGFCKWPTITDFSGNKHDIKTNPLALLLAVFGTKHNVLRAKGIWQIRKKKITNLQFIFTSLSCSTETAKCFQQ